MEEILKRERVLICHNRTGRVFEENWNTFATERRSDLIGKRGREMRGYKKREEKFFSDHHRASDCLL